MDPNSAWHWGFGAAGVGMTLGLIQYVLGGRALGTAGLSPVRRDDADAKAQALERGDALGRRRRWRSSLVGAASRTGVTAAHDRTQVVRRVPATSLLVITVAFFAWLFLAGNWTPDERKRLYVIVVFFVAAALFWGVFEQAGSTLNLFADRSTRNDAVRLGVPEQLVAVAERAVHLHPWRRSSPGCG